MVIFHLLYKSGHFFVTEQSIHLIPLEIISKHWGISAWIKAIPTESCSLSKTLLAEDLKLIPWAFEPVLLCFSCKTPPVSSKAFDQAVVLTAHLQNICQVGRDGWGGNGADGSWIWMIFITRARAHVPEKSTTNSKVAVFLSKEIQVWHKLPEPLIPKYRIEIAPGLQTPLGFKTRYKER